MDLNVTILIQIVNFIIAYIIIRTLLLKPTVAVILQEEEHRAKLDETLHSIETANKSKEDTLAREWDSCKKQFEEHSPEVIDSQQVLETPSTESLKEIPALDKKSIEPMTDRLANELTERLSHVR